THDFDWIRRNIPDGCEATLIDVTSAYAVLTLMGPKAREVLAPLCEGGQGSNGMQAIDNAALPFMRWKNLSIAGVPVRAQRVTYVGELGWELHVATEFAPR